MGWLIYKAPKRSDPFVVWFVVFEVIHTVLQDIGFVFLCSFFFWIVFFTGLQTSQQLFNLTGHFDLPGVSTESLHSVLHAARLLPQTLISVML